MEKLRKKLCDIVKTKDSPKLQDFLLNIETKSLLEIITTSLHKRDGFSLINSILTSLDCILENSASVKIQVYKVILKFLKCDEVLTEKENGQIVSSLIVNAENLPTDALHSLIQLYLDSLASSKQIVGSWSELFGRLISLTAKRNDIKIDGERYSGDQYQHHILTSLCNHEWNTKTAITLLAVYKDLKLSEDDIDDVLYKIEKDLKKVDYHSIPPILYNLILLSQQQLPERVLTIIIEYFNAQNLSFEKESNTDDDIDNGNQEELNEAAATMILHITHLSQYNSKLVKDYLKFVKSSTWLSNKLITTFNLSLALSLSSIDRYKDQILDALKSCILKHFKLKEKANTSLWIRKICFEDYDIEQVFINTAKMCQSGWDQVSQGMVNLCFSLLECGGGLKGELYPNQQAICIAISVLPLVMKKDSHLTPHVLCQLSSYLFTSASSHRYLNMLRRLVHVIPHALLEHIDLVRDILEQMILLPLSVAVELLHILLPLFKMSMTLKDALVLILRKMLFSREIERRQASVEGFILFLCHFRIMGTIPLSQGSMSFSTLSQVSADVHTPFNSNTNEALCQEFLGILRRCFSQQAEVKSVLYLGFYEVVKNNPKLGSNILTILYQHLLDFIELRQEALNPILFNKISSNSGVNAILSEPFGELLSSLCDCKSKYDAFLAKSNNNSDEEDEDVTDLLTNISSTCDTLAAKLADIDMDDLEFTNASFVPTTEKGKTNLIRAQSVIGALDALMNYTFNNGALIDEERTTLFISLFKTHKQLVDLVQKSSNKSGKKGESKDKKSCNTSKTVVKNILRLETIVKILNVCLGNDSGSKSKCVEMLQQNCELQLYLVSAIESIVKNIHNLPAQKRNQQLSYLKLAARLLLNENEKCLITLDADDSREHNRMSHMLSCLSLMLNTFFKLFKTKLPELMKDITGSSDEDLNVNLHLLAKKVQTMSRISFGRDASKMIKESTVLINLLSLITKHMEFSDDLINVYTWLHQICKDESINSPNFCDSIVTLLYRLNDQIKVNNSLPRLLALDIYNSIGDHEESNETNETVTHQIITKETCLAVLSATISYVDESLLKIELALSVLKCSLQLQARYDRVSVEKGIVLKFGILMQTLNEIIKSAVPQVSAIDLVFKSTTKLCSVLSIFVRYYLEMLKVKNTNALSDKFERLVYAYGSFKEEVFKMINYHQEAQSANNKNSTATLACRAMKASKIIPALIFSMETFEKLLVQLSKKSQINLMINVKLSGSRDFRISLPTLAKLLQEMEQQQNDESGNESEETVSYSREGSPASKRFKQCE